LEVERPELEDFHRGRCECLRDSSSYLFDGAAIVAKFQNKDAQAEDEVQYVRNDHRFGISSESVHEPQKKTDREKKEGRQGDFASGAQANYLDDLWDERDSGSECRREPGKLDDTFSHWIHAGLVGCRWWREAALQFVAGTVSKRNMPQWSGGNYNDSAEDIGVPAAGVACAHVPSGPGEKYRDKTIVPE